MFMSLKQVFVDTCQEELSQLESARKEAPNNRKKAEPLLAEKKKAEKVISTGQNLTTRFQIYLLLLFFPKTRTSCQRCKSST